VLDEPTNGLDPDGVRWLREFLGSFAAGGRTVLVSSHALAEVAQTVNQVLIINRGRLVIEASLDELTARVGGSVPVRTPQAAQLQAALRHESLEATTDNDHRQRPRADRPRQHQRARWRHRVCRRRPRVRARRQRLLAVGGLPQADLRGAVMIAQARAELLKLRTTRTALGLVLGMIVLVVISTLLPGLLTNAGHLHGKANQHRPA
jgi:ATPase subunit of ABC transporter with duplicated ATPase domains